MSSGYWVTGIARFGEKREDLYIEILNEMDFHGRYFLEETFLPGDAAEEEIKNDMKKMGVNDLDSMLDILDR